MSETVQAMATPEVQTILERLGIRSENLGACAGPERWLASGGILEVTSPIDGSVLAAVREATRSDYEKVLDATQEAFATWRMMPAPKRGEIVRQMGAALRAKKDDLGALVSIEMGKVLEEGKGEVQEMIDIADFAVGLSRQLYGRTMHSERPLHRMYEQWHPIGTVGIISAFNFPVAVWAWNAFIALVCGDPTVWKPSRNVPLSAIATIHIMNDVLAKHDLTGLCALVVGQDDEIGDAMTADKRLPLISATGSCRMGKVVGPKVQARMGRTILELGGNNAIIVTANADLELAVPAIVFGAAGTAGQRCTSTRRVYVHKSIRKKLEKRLVKAYEQIRVGNPLAEGVLMGPLTDERAVGHVVNAISQVRNTKGCEILAGGDTLPDLGPCYIQPTMASVPHDFPLLQEETFGPLLYIVEYEELEEAIQWQNDVPQGLSSSIFTLDMRESETFLSHMGSDCGIANVNIGTSGAEIGGAFGGEKETGGGREAGSDSWKQYMRRQTNTINWSKELPLAQGIKFDL